MTGDGYTLNQIGRIAYNHSRERGFHDTYADGDERMIPEQLMLIVTEAGEAMEAYREAPLGAIALPMTDPKGKPIGFDSELADIAIRVGHLATRMGIDLDAAVAQKIEYNKSRPHKHGGKRC